MSSRIPDDSMQTLDISFEQYCLSLQTLIVHGSATQHLEYLFQTYAIENESGISRAELFQLLQDHYRSGTRGLSDNRHHHQHQHQHQLPVDAAAVDARHFERLYTWLKKHINIYDRARTGYLPLKVTLEMLHTHPDALVHLSFQREPFVKKLAENNRQYREKAQAAAVSN